jgi:hypothetical protein
VQNAENGSHKECQNGTHASSNASDKSRKQRSMQGRRTVPLVLRHQILCLTQLTSRKSAKLT